MPGTELSIEYAALKSGLDRFVHLDKTDFIGRDALTRWQEQGFANRLVTLEVHDVIDADAPGNNPALKDSEAVGRATCGNFGFRVGKSLALAMISLEFALEGTTLEMDVLGAHHQVSVIAESPWDPGNMRLRA